MNSNCPRVLVIDDEPELLECVCLLIGQDQYSIQTASNGLEALEILKSHCFDAIISDYRMPKMDGLELLNEVRNSGNDVPFIFLSGNASRVTHVRKGKQGFCILLPKLEITNIAQFLAQILTEYADLKAKGFNSEKTSEFNLKELFGQQ